MPIEKSVAIEKIDSEIKRLKKMWLAACFVHSVEGMAINYSIMEYLISLKRDLGLIPDSRYITEIADLSCWRKEIYGIAGF